MTRAGAGGASGLVITNNLKDFKSDDVAAVGQRAISADEFLCEMLDVAPNSVLAALRMQASKMLNTAHRWSVGELLGLLAGMRNDRTESLAPRFAERASAALGIALQAPPKESERGPARRLPRSGRPVPKDPRADAT